MTDNHIINILKFCAEDKSLSCRDCPLQPKIDCFKLLSSSALDIINRQQANYEALEAQEEKEHQYCKNICEPKYKAKIDELEKKLAIAEAARAEFADKLIQEIVNTPSNFPSTYYPYRQGIAYRQNEIIDIINKVKESFLNDRN
jgi:hypothetical protein